MPMSRAVRTSCPSTGTVLTLAIASKSGTVDDCSGLQRDHFSHLPVCQSANSTRAEIRSEHSVKSVRTAAALKMSENDAARFFAGHFFDFLANVIADSAQDAAQF